MADTDRSDPDVIEINEGPLIQREAEEEPNRLRFRRVKIEQIYFKDQLCAEFKSSRFPMPENIRKARNRAIVLGFVEFVCCLAAFGFYDVRRSRVVLALIILNVLSTASGFRAKIKLSWWGLMLHACFSIAVIGGFYIYILIISLLGTESQDGNTSDTVILLVSSLPLVGIFCMGIYSCILLIMVDNELQARDKAVCDGNGNLQIRMEGSSDN